MGTIQVTAKRDFIESLTSARPIAALAELIWNGFDAKSDKVQVFLDLNEMMAYNRFGFVILEKELSFLMPISSSGV
jgi:hypothetical protein